LTQLGSVDWNDALSSPSARIHPVPDRTSSAPSNTATCETASTSAHATIAAAHAAISARGDSARHGDDRDHSDHRQERRRVDEEHQRGARGGEQQASDGRPDRAGQILVDRSERDRLRTLGWRDEFGLERLSDRSGQSLSDADPAQQDQQYGRRHDAGEIERAERGRRGEHHRLTGEDQLLAIEQVAQDASGYRQQEHREVRRLDRPD